MTQTHSQGLVRNTINFRYKRSVSFEEDLAEKYDKRHLGSAVGGRLLRQNKRHIGAALGHPVYASDDLVRTVLNDGDKRHIGAALNMAKEKKHIGAALSSGSGKRHIGAALSAGNEKRHIGAALSAGNEKRHIGAALSVGDEKRYIGAALSSGNEKRHIGAALNVNDKRPIDAALNFGDRKDETVEENSSEKIKDDLAQRLYWHLDNIDNENKFKEEVNSLTENSSEENDENGS